LRPVMPGWSSDIAEPKKRTLRHYAGAVR
jgi:hypothetical protein